MYYLKMAKLCVGKRKGDFNNFDLTDDLKIKALKSALVMSSENPNYCQNCKHRKRMEKRKENNCTICLIV